MKDSANPKEQIVRIPVNGLKLEAELVIPSHAKGLIIFAHGSGSSRHSPRNQFVAEELRKHDLATLLVDLLSEEEDIDYESRFDISLLSERLVAITDWATHDEQTKHLALGYFGASTGAAAAIYAAVGAEDTVKALVSRGGRVDLALETIKNLKVPTLFIVGEDDYGVREANEKLFLLLKCQKRLAIVPHATHLFEEPGTLEQVTKLTAEWFEKYLKG